MCGIPAGCGHGAIDSVAAALYMLTFSEGKGFFSAADADKITGDLFALQDDVEASAKDEIRSYISCFVYLF